MENKLIKVKAVTPERPAIMKQSLKQSSGSENSSLVQSDAPRNKDEALVHHLNLLAEASESL